MPVTKATTVMQNIVNGEYDADLRQLNNACSARRKTVEDTAKQVMFIGLSVGDKVRIVNARPRYLIGATAVIVRKNQKKVVIDLDQPRRRFQFGITCPVNMIEKI